MSLLIKKCITALRCLPGIGPKSAQRMLFHLLQNNRQAGIYLAEYLQKTMLEIKNCERCHNLTEDQICNICQDNKRDKHILCIVESPADLMAIELTGEFNGQYFVLLGRLSPLDGIGPEEIGIKQLFMNLHSNVIQEVILATNPTVEGEATAYYLSEKIKNLNIKVSKIAYGVPMGGELEYIDGGTISRALLARELI